MARGTSSALNTEMRKKVVRPVLLFEGEFSSGLVNLWTGPGTLSFNAKTWYNLGKLMSVSTVTEAGNLEAQGLICTLSGVPNDIVGKVLTECKHGYQGTLWLGALDSAGALVADASKDILYKGFLDIATIKKSRKTSTVEIRYESRILNRRVRVRRYTLEDQQSEYPGDLGPSYINALMDQNLATGSGAVSGLGCFSGNTRLKTPNGASTFREQYRLYLIAGVVTLLDGEGRPGEYDMLMHEACGRKMLDMGSEELVTLAHLLRKKSRLPWRPAAEVLLQGEPVVYHGEVFNAHRRTRDPELQHYALVNGYQAHNSKYNDGGGNAG